jgi:hypothetical protein
MLLDVILAYDMLKRIKFEVPTSLKLGACGRRHSERYDNTGLFTVT